MEIKTVPPLKVLYFTTRTSIAGLDAYVVTAAKKLYAEAVRQDILPAGPIIWQYIGMDGKPDTIFTLEICLPVEREAQPTGIFLYKVLQHFTCATAVHADAWSNLSATYATLVPAVFAAGKRPGMYSRELYYMIDMHNPQGNLVEIQLGID